MMSIRFSAVLILISGFLVAAATAAELDRFGGDTRITGNNDSGFFRVEVIDGRFWLITPDNHGFFSMAHTTTQYNDMWGGFCPPLNSYPTPYGNRAKYNHSRLAWVDALRERMTRFGFNSLGAWGDANVPELTESVRVLFITHRHQNVGGRMVGSGFPDVFDQVFQDAAVNRANAILTPSKDNPFTIGSFPDNEIGWQGVGKWQCHQPALVDAFIDLPAATAGKQAFVAAMQERYETLAELNAAWGTTYQDWTGAGNTVANMQEAHIPDDPAHPERFQAKLAFTSRIAERYYQVSTDAMRAADPNHLVFSARWALWTSALAQGGLCDRHARFSEAIWEQAGRFCDVIAVNSYHDADWAEQSFQLWTRLIRAAGKPFMITEWASFANDTMFRHDPHWLEHQRDRGQFYHSQVAYLINKELHHPEMPEILHWCMGNQWFQFYDEPALGRTDGERVNFGMFNVKDEGYLTMLEHMQTVNEQVYDRLVEGTPITLPQAPSLMGPNGDGIAAKPTFRWMPVTGHSVTLLYSPEICFPEEQTIQVRNLTGDSYTPQDALAAGEWYWCAKLVDESNDRGGRYSKPVTFRVEPTYDGKLMDAYLKMEDTSAWRSVALDDGDYWSTTYIFQDRDVAHEGESSARVVYTINSMHKQTAEINPVQEGEATLAYQGPAVNLTGVNAYAFALRTGRTVDAQGVPGVTSQYLHVRLVNQDGSVALDRPVDPEGELEPLTWNEISLEPLVGPRDQVTRIEFYIPFQEGLPWDQRMTVWLDDLTTQPKSTLEAR